MLRYWKRFRMLVACALFYLCFQTVGAAELYGLLWLSRWRGEDAVAKRRRLGPWPGKWMLRWSWCCRKLGGMRIRFVWHPSCKGATGPFIMILNHFGTVDGIIMAEVLRALGESDSRPVAAYAARKIPLLGRVWQELCVAFVKPGAVWSRNRIRFMAMICGVDGAHFAIAPEGTIMTREKWGGGNTVILPAHDGGFEVGVSELDRPVLSLTTRWHDFDPYLLSDMGIMPPGTDVEVEIRVLPSARGRARETIRAEWERKAEWLREKQSQFSGDA